MVLDPRYVEMVQTPGTLSLEPLWELLKTQPGFVPAHAIPPLCRIKTWEPHPTNRKTLIEPNCNASLIRADYTEAGAKKLPSSSPNPSQPVSWGCNSYLIH